MHPSNNFSRVWRRKVLTDVKYKITNIDTIYNLMQKIKAISNLFKISKLYYCLKIPNFFISN